MTPEAIARYQQAVACEQLVPRPWGQERFTYTMRGYYGRTQRCRGGSHWACNGRRGRGVEQHMCPCPCHVIDGWRINPPQQRTLNGIWTTY